MTHRTGVAFGDNLVTVGALDEFSQNVLH